jgi:hypothetical protein
MNQRELLLYWSTLAFEVSLCVLVYVRHLRKYLPLFAVYSSVLLACSVGFGLTYHHFGFRSVTTYYAAWITAAADLAARSLAIAELCRYRLRPYRGIWALTWRIFAGLSLLLFGHAAVDAWGQPNWIATYGLTIERDIGISSVVILLALLLIRNYYGLTFDPLQKWITIGLFFFCIVEVVNNTMLRGLFTSYIFFWPSMRSQVERANESWNTIRFSAFIISMTIWCFALRKPLPAVAKAPELLPAEVYAELSPAVNMRLRTFNDRLQEMLKP